MRAQMPSRSLSGLFTVIFILEMENGGFRVFGGFFFCSFVIRARFSTWNCSRYTLIFVHVRFSHAPFVKSFSAGSLFVLALFIWDVVNILFRR